MNRNTVLLIVAGVLAGVVLGGRAALRAQFPANPLPSAETAARGTAPQYDVKDALSRPYDFPFAKPTSLEKIREHLSRTLNAPVVFDKAALDRRDIHVEDEVALELKGVRLKTGLKLLLDQVGMTYRVVVEDNLLVITDSEGADDPLERIWAELRSLHRDLHDVQDAVDDLLDAQGDEGGGEHRLRKPTIIEEMPGEEPAAAPGEAHPSAPRSAPRARPETPGGEGNPRPAPSRIPLGGRRRVASV